METKDFLSNELVKNYMTAAANAGMEVREDATIGNNGYVLGQVFYTVGMSVVERTINGNPVAFIGVQTQDGNDLSLKSLMNISNLSGFETQGEFENQSRGENGEVITDFVKAEVLPRFKFEDVTQPKTRMFLAFAAHCEETGYFVNKKVTYLGKAVKPFVAKQDSKIAFNPYKAGDKRVMTVKLWKIEDMTEAEISKFGNK